MYVNVRPLASPGSVGRPHLRYARRLESAAMSRRPERRGSGRGLASSGERSRRRGESRSPAAGEEGSDAAIGLHRRRRGEGGNREKQSVISKGAGRCSPPRRHKSLRAPSFLVAGAASEVPPQAVYRQPFPQSAILPPFPFPAALSTGAFHS